MEIEFTIIEAPWETEHAKLLHVRKTVFVVEQEVPEHLERDADDSTSLHLLAIDREDRPVGTARLLPNGRIGRVAVLKEFRRKGVGAALMRRLISTARESGHRETTLHAQTHSIPFYQSMGYEVSGSVFEEAGIPHCEMRLSLR